MATDDEATVKLLWGLRDRPTRGPRPVLSVEGIARTAVEVADTDGMAAVSMQRVASELDFTKMALYRHVQGKADLIAVMIEAAVGEPPDLDKVPGGWRTKLEEWARQMWATWDRHPWLPGATVGARVMGPTEFGWTECALGALEDTGLDGLERMDAVVVLSGHIRNTRSMSSAGTQPWTDDRQLELLRQHGDLFPALTAAAGSTATAQSSDHRREFGLGLILDGLAQLIEEQTPARTVAH